MGTGGIVAGGWDIAEVMEIRVQERNDACAKIDWQFSTADARNKFRRFYKN
ncbi:MAG: hypothetical protein R2941_17640 [Desulfobacterales bacterium]